MYKATAAAGIERERYRYCCCVKKHFGLSKMEKISLKKKNYIYGSALAVYSENTRQ
jgi:hypothetical protein